MYLGLLGAANVAVVLLVVISLGVLLLQLREGVDHDTRHDAAKHGVHKCGVADVEEEPAQFESFHRLTDGSPCPEFDDATYNILTGVLGQVFLAEEDGSVCVEGNDIEDKDKDCCEDGEQGELLDIVENSLEDIGELADVSENVEDVNGIPLDSPEVAHQCCRHEHQNRQETALVSPDRVQRYHKVTDEVILHKLVLELLQHRTQALRHLSIVPHQQVPAFNLMLLFLLFLLGFAHLFLGRLLESLLQVVVVLGQAEGLPQLPPDYYEPEGHQQLQPSQALHDELGKIAGVVEGGDGFLGVVVDQHERDHEEADEEGNLAGDAPDFGGIVRGDFEADTLGFEGEGVRLVLQGEVEVYLLGHLLLHLQQGNELVSLSAPLDPEHNVVSGVAGELVEYGVVGEVYVLQTHLLAVVGADFDGPDQPLEKGDELGDVVVAIAFGVGANTRHELNRLHPILFLLQDYLVLVSECDFVLLLAVGVDLLDDVKDREDVNNLVAEQGLGFVGLVNEGLDGLLVELGEQGQLEVTFGVVVCPVYLV